MKILFKDARILTLADDSIFRGDLIVKGNTIYKIGKDLNSYGPFDRTVECGGNVIMPGFKNAHTHSAMVFLRSFADDETLHDWLYNSVFPYEANLKPGDVYALSKVAFLEYLTSGITACFDMYYSADEIAKSSQDFGMRTVILGTPTSFKESISKLRSDYESINGKYDLVSFRLGFHAEYTATEEMLIELSKLSHEKKEPIFTHSSETRTETDGCIARHGLTPTQYFDKLGLYDYGGGAFHCCYFDETDKKIFRDKKLYAVSCPGSNTKLASGIAPLQDYVDFGMNVSLGTDGPASNNALDFFREMFLATGLQKIKTGDPRALKGEVVLHMATVNSAHAMGLFNADTLQEGKLADIIEIDLNKPNMQPINNIIKNIVYSGSKENVKLTMINGKILYEDGKFYVDEPVELIYKKAQEITSRIIKKTKESKVK